MPESHTNLQHRLALLRKFFLTFWFVLVALPTVVLLTELSKGTGQRLTVDVLTALTILYQIRWTVGNNGYLEATYRREAPWLASVRMGASGSRSTCLAGRTICDIVLLVLHTSSLCWMAQSVRDPESFCRALAVLLLSDLWWLVYERRVWPRWITLLFDLRRQLREHRPGHNRRLVVFWDEAYAPRTWTWGNAGAAVILLVFIAVRDTPGTDETTLTIAIVSMAGMINSYIDYQKTRCGLLGMDPERVDT